MCKKPDGHIRQWGDSLVMPYDKVGIEKIHTAHLTAMDTFCVNSHSSKLNLSDHLKSRIIPVGKPMYACATMVVTFKH